MPRVAMGSPSEPSCTLVFLAFLDNMPWPRTRLYLDLLTAKQLEHFGIYVAFI